MDCVQGRVSTVGDCFRTNLTSVTLLIKLKQLAEERKLGYDLNATVLIIQKMKDEGYIALNEKNEFALVYSCEQARIKNLEYFNPMTLIRTYVGQGLKK